MTEFWKNKTVTAYIALSHHTRYIIPVMQRLEQMGAHILYLVGQAERSQEITAIERGLAYHHVFDFLSDEDYPEILKNYENMKKGFAKTMMVDTAFSAVIPTVMDKTLFTAAQEFTAFKNFIIRTTPDLCFALHENNRWGKTFSFHAKKANIPFITLQEGLFSTSDFAFAATGHIQHSTLGLLWGNGSKSYLCDYEAPEDRAIPAGNTLLANKIIRLKKDNVREKKRADYGYDDRYVVLLMFSAVLHPVEEFIPLFEAFHHQEQKTFLVKFHPITARSTMKRWLDGIPEHLKENCVFIHGEESTYDLMAMSDLCILSDTSTTGLEALAIGRPLAFLKLKAPAVMKSSLPQKGAAMEYSPLELKQLLEKNPSLPVELDQKKINAYLAEELTDPEKSIDTTIHIMASVISANQESPSEPLMPRTAARIRWSIFIPVIDSPEQLLTILESVATHSESHEFEVILIRPQVISPETLSVLDSLKGDVSIFQQADGTPMAKTLNDAALVAGGKTFLFLASYTFPGSGWLNSIEQATHAYGPEKIFGGKIVDLRGNIVHAGILINKNHSPVTAFQHLDGNFPPANNPSSFQMIDGFMAIPRNCFFSTGGMHLKMGRYRFMDFCLRINERQEQENPIFYIPSIPLFQLDAMDEPETYADAIQFYSRWHGRLWSSEDAYYQKQGISRAQLDKARMNRAMETAFAK